MVCCWKHILTGGKLLNVAKSLEFSGIDDDSMMAGDQDILVNFVTYHTVPHRHPQASLGSTIKKRNAP